LRHLSLYQKKETCNTYPYWNFPAETSLVSRGFQPHQFTLPI
jgi:hypothetical protein